MSYHTKNISCYSQVTFHAPERILSFISFKEPPSHGISGIYTKWR